MELSTLKHRAIIVGKLTLAASIFASGIIAHDPLQASYKLATDLFAPDTTQYTRSLSAHDKAVIAEFNSTTTQEQCHNAAEARVFLKEAQVSVLQAQHSLAESKRLELASMPSTTTSNFQNDANFTASLDIQSAATSYKTNKSSTK